MGRILRGGSSTDSPSSTCVLQSPGSAMASSWSSDNIFQANGDVKNVPVEYVAETKLPTDIGQFQLRAYRVPGAPLGQEPCVIYCRDKPPFGVTDWAEHVPVRIHDQCLTSEVFRSQRYVICSGPCCITVILSLLHVG